MKSNIFKVLLISSVIGFCFSSCEEPRHMERNDQRGGDDRRGNRNNRRNNHRNDHSYIPVNFSFPQAQV